MQNLTAQQTLCLKIYSIEYKQTLTNHSVPDVFRCRRRTRQGVFCVQMAMTQVKPTALLCYLHAVAVALWALNGFGSTHEDIQVLLITRKQEVLGITHDAYFSSYI